MLLGLAAGKIGDLVFYRDGGEQRTRTRVVPKNPRSIAQMTQRVKIANVGGMYRAASQILRDSFSNRPSNQSGYNAFASGAIINAPYLTSEMAKAGVCIPQPAMMSRGVLPTIDYIEVNSEATNGIGIPVNFSTLRPTTLGAVANGLIQQVPSLQEGDELNFVTLRFTPIGGVDSEVDIYNVSAIVNSFVLDTTSTTPLMGAQIVTTDSYVAGAALSTNEQDGIFMSFVVHSRTDADGRLQVSTQWAYLSPAAQTLYDNYRTDAALLKAIQSYGLSGVQILR